MGTQTIQNKRKQPRKAPALLVALLFGATGLGLCPPIHYRLLSVDQPGNPLTLWLLCGASLGLCVLAVLLGRRLPMALLAMFFGILSILGMEFTFRAVMVTTFPSPTLLKMAGVQEALNTSSVGLDMVAHPFLHYTGARGRGDFNLLGFPGVLPPYTKSPGVVRVACLGGSTTAGMYGELEQYLDRAAAGSRYKVLNFSMVGWSSVHSLVNLVLNVVDFAPDYIVIHHGWNDHDACAARCTSGDHAHKYRPLNYRQVSTSEKQLTRLSYIYRFLMLNQLSNWINPNQTIEVSSEGPCRELCSERGPGYLYKRNLETMIHVAAGRHITPVLATMPHKLRPPNEEDKRALAKFDEANKSMREVASKYSEQVILVDLDRLITGKMEEHFSDVAHIGKEGRKAKAEAIGRAIIKHVGQGRATPMVAPPAPAPPTGTPDESRGANSP